MARLRGQTLVLFALSLLLLTLMVCMTLSIGMKAKEKMELEMAADAAAYSQAVATARTFNTLALTNRALVSHMVAMTGVQSLISWSGLYRATVLKLIDGYETPKAFYLAIALASCPCAAKSDKCAKLCKCANDAISDINDTQDELRRADREAGQVFDALDGPAGLEARSLQLTSIHERQLELFARLKEELLLSRENPLPIARTIARGLDAGGQEVSALSASATVNARELVGSCPEEGQGARTGAVCERRVAGKIEHFLWATMGTRGHSFVTGREDGERPIIQKLSEYMPRKELLRVSSEGSAYFASSRNHAQRAVSGEAGYADDHSQITMAFLRASSPCPNSPPVQVKVDAWVRSDDAMQDNDEHFWGKSDSSDRLRQHTMGDCVKCPGMWPPYMDYNTETVTEAGDLYGQPKNYAVLQRDYSARPPAQADPWNLLFRFRLNPAAQGTVFDNTGLRLSDGRDISRAVALSAGVAYYHRGGPADTWLEPPNLLNPFWRATLVSATVDAPRGDVRDLVTTLSATSPEAAQVVKALAAQGYQAW